MTATPDLPALLWEPAPEYARSSNMVQYMHWLTDTRGLSLGTYAELHAWSVTHLEAFWESLFDYFAIESDTPYSHVLTSHAMPGAHWFPGAHVNFARHVLRHAAPGRARPAIFHQSEGGAIGQLSWGELEEQVGLMAGFLRSRGIGVGDVVAAYITNIPEAIIGFLATATVGAIWSSCSPEFGVQAVRERFEPLAPKVLIATDGYRFGGKLHDRASAVRAFVADFTSLEVVIHVFGPGWEDADTLVEGAVDWKVALAEGPLDLSYAQTDFEQPLFVCFSSGTTGVPKAIVHGHGGLTLELLKLHLLHENLTAQSRSFFYTTTAWIVWMSSVVSSLLCGGAVVLYDGSPVAPDPTCLWRLAAETGVTHFGGSPVFLGMMIDTGIVPRDDFDLSRIRSVMMTGSPASPEVMTWAARNIAEGAHVGNLSGGTDLCTAIVGMCPILPVYAGEFQCAQLGIDAVAYSDAGVPLIGEVGELVIREPIPTMPLGFLNDPDGVRLHGSYYETFSGAWRQGDFFLVTDRGSSRILGRSDATLNRHGIRIGTAEIYRILETIPEIADSLVVNLELPGGRSIMPLFVKTAAGIELSEQLKRLIKDRLRIDASPRHVPDRILACPAVPYTISGKKLEVPVKRILLGAAIETVANAGAIRNPESLAFFSNVATQEIAKE